MDDHDEQVWRKALQAKGKDWVMAELHRRAGQPGDAVYDVVFVEPFPTREFCHRWCAEEENRIFRMSWHTVAALVALAVFAVCSVKAVQSWNEPGSASMHRSATAAATSPATMPRRNSDQMTNDQPNRGMKNSAVTSSSASSPPSLCSYAIYQTAECNNSPYGQWSGSANGASRQQSGSTTSSVSMQSTNSAFQTQPMTSAGRAQSMPSTSSQSHH